MFEHIASQRRNGIIGFCVSILDFGGRVRQISGAYSIFWSLYSTARSFYSQTVRCDSSIGRNAHSASTANWGRRQETDEANLCLAEKSGQVILLFVAHTPVSRPISFPMFASSEDQQVEVVGAAIVAILHTASPFWTFSAVCRYAPPTYV